MRCSLECVVAVVAVAASVHSPFVSCEGEGRHTGGFRRQNEAPPPSVRVYPTGDTITREFAESINIYFDSALFDPRSASIIVVDPDVVRHGCPPVSFDVDVDKITLHTNVCRANRELLEGTYTIVFELASLGGGNDREEFINEITFYAIERAPWPFENDMRGWPPTEPNLAGSLMENFQSFGAPYWHGGLDIITTHNPNNREGDLFCPVDGTVVRIVQYSSGAAYWSIMVEDLKGFIWQFHHIDPPTRTVVEGQRVSRGELLGKVIYWGSQWNGANYHHVHLNIVRPDPRWTSIPNPYIDGWQFFNPLDFLEVGNFTNTDPYSKDGVMYFLENDNNVAFASSADNATPVLSGRIDIIMHVMCEWIPTNNVPGHPWPNGIFQIGYHLTRLDGPGGKSSENLIEMNKMPDEWSECLPNREERCRDQVLFYVHQDVFTYNGATFRTTMDYNTRELYYRVTNIARGEPHATFGYLDTAETLPLTGERRYPNGRYEVTITASDYYRNVVEFKSEVSIVN